MFGKSLLLGLLFALAALTQLGAQPCDCVTTGNCPVPITDNGVYSGTLDVTVVGANDLAANPLTSVCFTITHTWIGDLSVSLTSPSGLHYLIMADASNNYGGCGTQQDNAEVCIVLGDGNPLTNNTEYACNSAPCSAGTCCLNGNWTVSCGGVVDPITGALEAPNCDLNDFNIAGQPANGTWTLSVLDVCNMDSGTLDNFSLTFQNGTVSCIACEADGGLLDSLELVGCVGDSSLLLNLAPDYGGDPVPDTADYDYAWVISQNGVILDVDTILNFINQPVGVYAVHGFSYLESDAADLASMIGLDTALIINQLESSTAPFCADFSENVVTITVLASIPPTVLTPAVCLGECITVGGQQVCQSDTLVLDSWQGCDSIVQVQLSFILPDTVDLLETVCEGGCVTIGGQQYCPPGQHYIHLPTWQGCDSVVHLTFQELVVNASISPASPPALTCDNPSLTLDASGSTPGTATFAWSGPGSFSSSQSTVIVTTSGTYTVTVSDNTLSPACTATASVEVTDDTVFPSIALVGPAPSICVGETFDLSSLDIQDANATGAVLTYHSGTPATPSNALPSPVVSPTATTTFYVLATRGVCTNETSAVLTVNEVPTADFTANGNSCISGSTTVSYAGNATAGAGFTWDFGGGTATPGTGPGPHTVTWPSAGMKTITLFVVENGCTSDTASQTVQVDGLLPAPNINCATTTSSITFTWDDVAGNEGYTVTFPNGEAAVQNSPTSYTVNGLNPGDSVTLEVVALSTSACGNSSAQQTCTAQDCPAVTLDITPEAPICRTANSPTVNLQATVTGGTGGNVIWSGSGVADSSGVFDPTQANIGANTITATYWEGNCPYSETTVIEVYETPMASFTALSPVCVGGAAIITYNGTSEPGLTYVWDFGGGAAMPGTGVGPHNVTWPDAGLKTVTLLVQSLDGCVSQVFSGSVDVVAPIGTPVVNCSSTTSSVMFSWATVPGASGYTVSFPSGHTGTQLSATSYEVTGLTPNESVDIEVVALGGQPCGNAVAAQTCKAEDCPNVSLSISPIGDICRDAATSPLPMSYNLTGGTPNGSVSWSGLGVDANGLFDPSQAAVGANTVTAIYDENGACTVTADLTLNVFDAPVANFTVAASTCVGTAATVAFVGNPQPGWSYFWDFGGGIASPGTGLGPHSVTWNSPGQKNLSLTVDSPDGCVSNTFFGTVQVDSPAAVPQISCNSTTTAIDFSWANDPNATAYNVTVLSGPTGTQPNGNSIQFNNLAPNSQVCIEVQAVSAGACAPVTAQLCCSTQPCPAITVDVLPVPAICTGAVSSVALQANVAGSNGTGTGIWSGVGVANGQFDPTVAGLGQHTVVYTFSESACAYKDSAVVNVFPTPVADFEASSPICVTDAATVNFTGTADQGAAIFTWDFAGGTANPGVGPGPQQVHWATDGQKEIQLTVEQYGCTATAAPQFVDVQPALTAPAVTCSSTTEEIVFAWPDVPNATNYQVVVVAGPAGTPGPTGNSFVFSGLNPGQPVTIQVTAEGNTICPFPVATASCSAQPCPDFTFELAPVGPICLTGATTPAALSANVNGVGQSGFGEWNGIGVSGSGNYQFDPAAAGTGTHLLTYTYYQANCTYAEIMEVQVLPPPVADAGEDGELTCWESEKTVRLGGSATSTGTGISLLWTAAGGTFPGDAASLHPEVTVPGIYTLTVTNGALGCSSSDQVAVTSSQDLPVPQLTVQPISCRGDKDAHVNIDGVAGGSEPYLFSLNGEPFVATNSFPYLSAGSYELTVMDAAGCENSVVFDVKDGGDLSLDLTANLVGKNLIHLGDSVRLTALVSLPVSSLDSIVWTNTDALDCTDCLDPMASPIETTTFGITVYMDGCEASDELTIFVENSSPVYAPTAFSPNGDGVNDVFMIYGNASVALIKNFYVFDRWGEMVFQQNNLLPGDATGGWDGRLDGQVMNPALFVWFAEIAFANGETKVLEGEVSLVR